MISEFGTGRHDGCLSVQLCAKFGLNISYNLRVPLLVIFASPRGPVASQSKNSVLGV